MRIGLVAGGRAGRTGGLDVVRRDLAAALDRHGDRADERVIVPSAAPVPRARAALHELAVLAGRRGSGSAVDALGLDVVHYPATRIDDVSVRTPVVLTFFDMQEELLPGFFGWRERWARRLAHRASARRADVVIAPSDFTARCLRERYRVHESRLVTLPGGGGEGFDSEPRPGERERVRQRYGLPEEYIFYPANPWPHKNHERLLRALLSLKARGRTVPSLVCAGRLTGETRSAGRLAAEAGLAASDVVDVGFVDEQDVPALYRGARLLVFPSLFEGFGLPVLEAMASGCPVATSSAASLAELGGDAVVAFDPTDVEAMAWAIDRVLTDRGLAAELVRRGRDRARLYGWEQIVPRIEQAYRTAARADRPRSLGRR